MDNKILLISSGSTFMVNAIKKNLTEAGLLVISTEQKVNELDKYMHWYNEERIKMTLGGMSPLEYRRSLGIAV